MRAETLSTYRTLHTWTGLIAGMFLFIAFYAGSLTVFKDAITEWASPPSVSQTADRSVPMAQSKDLITRTIAAHPEAAEDFWLYLDRDDTPPPERMAWEDRPEGADEHDTLSGHHVVAAVAQDGSVVVEDVPRSKVGEFIYMIHAVVGLPVDMELTRILMGFVTLAYFLSLVSGVILILPRLTKDLFALRIDAKIWRMWRDAHVAVGVMSLPFHLVMAVTASAFAFHDIVYISQNFVVHDGQLREKFMGAPSTYDGPHEPEHMMAPEDLLASVRAVAPAFDPYAIQYLRVDTPRAVARVWGRDPRGFEARAPGGFAVIDPYTGVVNTTEYVPGEQSASGVVLSSVFATHFATYGGPVVRWMYFVLGMAGAWLFYSGNLLWVESRRKKRSRRDPNGPVPEQTRNTRWMASGTVGVCLGAVTALSATLVSAKWLVWAGMSPGAWHHTVYYGVFLAAVAWSFWRGGARAAVELLGLAALAAFSIPLTSLAASVVPGLWSHAHTWPVDVVAAAIGVGFVGMARTTAQRVFHGPEDSVWSAKAA